MPLSRRQFITLAGAGAASAVVLSPLKALYTREAKGKSVLGQGYGALQKDPNGLLDLPTGFQYRTFSRTGESMSDGSLVPGAHDGMAAFAGVAPIPAQKLQLQNLKSMIPYVVAAQLH